MYAGCLVSLSLREWGGILWDVHIALRGELCFELAYHQIGFGTIYKFCNWVNFKECFLIFGMLPSLDLLVVVVAGGGGKARTSSQMKMK